MRVAIVRILHPVGEGDRLHTVQPYHVVAAGRWPAGCRADARPKVRPRAASRRDMVLVRRPMQAAPLRVSDHQHPARCPLSHRAGRCTSAKRGREAPSG